MEDSQNNQVEIMMDVIKELKLTDYVKNFNGKNGALWSTNPEIKNLFNAVVKKDDNHSGASLALCFRICKKMLNE